jgi:hypothetical protein
MSHLQQLPDTLALLESQIDNAIEELGSDSFQNLPGGWGLHIFYFLIIYMILICE